MDLTTTPKRILFGASLCMAALMIWSISQVGAAPPDGPGLEVYSATDPEADPIAVEVPEPVEIDPSKPYKAEKTKGLARPTRLKARVQLPKKELTVEFEELGNLDESLETEEVSTPEKAQASFAKVPKEQIASVSRRIRLVDLIVRRYGIAFDYRTMTTPQLEEVVRHLEAHIQN